MAQTAIVFDLDGTLVDVSIRHYSTYKQIIRNLGGAPLDKDEYWQLKRYRTAWLEILKRSNLDPKSLNEFMVGFVNLIEQPQMLKLDTVLPGAKELLEQLRGSYKLFLVSLRRSDKNLVSELKGLRLYDLFDKVISSHTDGETNNMKASVIRELLKSDTKGLIVGDTEADILAAKQLGLVSVAVRSGIRADHILSELKPDYILNDIRELPGIISKQA